MRIGIFYNALLCALKNGEIESIAEGMSKLAEEGVCYYEVFADTVCSKGIKRAHPIMDELFYLAEIN